MKKKRSYSSQPKIVEEFREAEVDPEKIASYLGAEFSEDKGGSLLRYTVEVKKGKKTIILLFFSQHSPPESHLGSLSVVGPVLQAIASRPLEGPG